MRKVITPLLILLFAYSPSAQIEDWAAELDTAQSPNRKFELLSLLTKNTKELSKKLQWVQEWLELAQAQQDLKAEVDAYYQLLLTHGNQGHYTKVQQEGTSALKKAIAYGDPQIILKIYNLYAGYGYYSVQAFDSAVILYREALDYAKGHEEKIPDSTYIKLVSRMYPILVEIYARTGQNEAHQATMKEFQEIAYASKDDLAIALAHLNISTSFLRSNDYLQAKEILLNGYQYAQNTKALTVLLNFYTQLFRAYYGLEQLDSAAYFAQLQYEQASELGYENDAHTALYQLAETEIDQGKQEQALVRLRECLVYFDQAEDQIRAARTEVLAARALSYLGRPAEALPLVMSAKKRAAGTNDMLMLNQAIHHEAQTLYALKRYRDAYNAFSAYHYMKDSIKSAEARQEVEKLEVNLELNEQKLQNQSLKEEQLLQRTTYRGRNRREVK
ncbi:MAG: hypothetical protein H6573_00115 [Lewinellaceae bacterium]|nr:hypothetical protein [Phaeodactylibacter sp.]MCB0563050.1 hypothetical protein [Phaeodactylibacter sp.]MCB9345900.1 hypothetical protein [Lewinellaceae bacterium]